MKKEIKLIDIFYGNKCNLACNNCDTHSDVITTKELDPELENIKESIRLTFDHFEVDIWALLGGEPLLYLEKIEKIISYVRSLDPEKTLLMATNGTLISKNLDRLAYLITKYKIHLQVSDHYVNFKDKSKSEKIFQSVAKLASLLEIKKMTNGKEWWEQVVDLESGGAEWQEHIRIAGAAWDNEKSWIGDNFGIFYVGIGTFQTIHNYNEEGKPKPFNSPNPKDSYWNSCPGKFCSLLRDKKIYKCAALGTLESYLRVFDSLSDADWKKYLTYKPLDLENCTREEIDRFVGRLYCHIDECSMCPQNSIEIIKTEEQVLPKYRKSKTVNIVPKS